MNSPLRAGQRVALNNHGMEVIAKENLHINPALAGVFWTGLQGRVGMVDEKGTAICHFDNNRSIFVDAAMVDLVHSRGDFMSGLLQSLDALANKYLPVLPGHVRLMVDLKYENGWRVEIKEIP